MKIKTGDPVIVIAGEFKGQTGKGLQALPKTPQGIVEGVNGRKKHVKPNQNNAAGQIRDVTLPIDVSNVAYLDPEQNCATKIGYKLTEDGTKVRYCKKSGIVVK